MRALFFNHEQYTGFENEAGNIEFRLPMLSSGAITEHENYIYQRVQTEHGFEAMIEGAFEAVRRFKPDLVVNMTTWPHKSIPPGHIADIENLGYPVLTAYWDTIPDQDIAVRLERPLFYASSHFCEGGSFLGYARYRLWNDLLGLGKGVIYLAGNTLVNGRFHPDEQLENSSKTIDIALIGSLYEERITLLNYLNDALAGRGIQVSHFGGHFSADSSETGRWLDEAEYVDVLNKSKIVLCPAGASYQWGVRGKIFEAMACKAFCLIEQTPDTARTIPDTAAVSYSSPEECLNSIIHYLDHEDERRNRAAAGYRWFNKTYDSAAFWADFLNGVAAGRTDFTNTPFVEENYAQLRDMVVEALDGREPTRELMESMNFGV